MIILEYIWIDGYNTTRSKTRCLDLDLDVGLDVGLGIDLKDVPHWNYDGSSTGQAETRNSSVFGWASLFFPLSPFILFYF